MKVGRLSTPLGSITSRCSGSRPDTRERRKSSLQHHAHGQKRIGCLFVGGNNFSGVCKNCLLSCLLLREEGEECHWWEWITKGNTRIKCLQMRANACVNTRFSTRVCAKIVRAFCVCVGHLSLTCTVHYLHYNDTYIYAYNILANYITYTYTTYTCTTLQYDTKKMT